MDLLAMGAQLLSAKLGLNVDKDTIASALQSLLGNADGKLDLAGLASRFASSGSAGTVPPLAEPETRFGLSSQFDRNNLPGILELPSTNPVAIPDTIARSLGKGKTPCAN